MLLCDVMCVCVSDKLRDTMFLFFLERMEGGGLGGGLKKDICTCTCIRSAINVLYAYIIGSNPRASEAIHFNMRNQPIDISNC